MKPIFHITIDREELSNAVKDRVLSIQISDVAGYESDNLVLTLDARNKPSPLKLPKRGAIIEVSLGYERMRNSSAHVPLTLMGRYELAEIGVTDAPWSLALTANGMSMMRFPKSSRNDNHENLNLKELVEKLGKRMGYGQVDVHPMYEKVWIEFEQQKNMPDMEFLNLLAGRYAAFPKIHNLTLRFHPKRGDNFVDEDVTYGNVIPGTVDYASTVRGVYGHIHASSFSWDTGRLTRMEVSPANPEEVGTDAVMELPKLYETAEKAMHAAQSKQQFLESAQETLSFKHGGNPRFISHRKLRLIGDWYPGIPKDWVIVSSTHTWQKGDGSEDGYTTGVKCELPNANKQEADDSAN